MTLPAYCFAKPATAERPLPVSLLQSEGLTQTPDAGLQLKIAATEATGREKRKRKPAVRTLSPNEMKSVYGRGSLRNRSFSGTLPWQRGFRDINLCNGNLFKSFTDLQVAPGRGQGLVVQRSYNSSDDREGAFGTGWTHAYEIRMEEAGVDPNDETEKVQRTDFFGGKHTYTRDADGLYTPPPYLFDETDSKYDVFVVNGPSAPLEDSEKGMDGTTKHFVHVATNPDGSINYNIRACDYIEDRHGNRSNLTYGFTATAADGSTEKKVTAVTDPVGRTLTLTWANLGTAGDPHYRITQVEGPADTYRVTYEYYTNAGDPSSYLNLWKVHLDPSGLDRVTTYAYGSYSDADGTENGLLSGISDPLGHTVSYQYGRRGFLYQGAPKPFVFANAVTEPGTNGVPVTWNIDATSFGPGSYSNATIYCNPSQTSSDIGHIFSDVYTDPYGRCDGVAGERFGLPIMTYRFTYDTSNKRGRSGRCPLPLARQQPLQRRLPVAGLRLHGRLLDVRAARQRADAADRRLSRRGDDALLQCVQVFPEGERHGRAGPHHHL